MYFFRKKIILTTAFVGQLLRSILEKFEVFHKFLFARGLSAFRKTEGMWKAYYVYYRAKKLSPAYADFINKYQIKEVGFSGMLPTIIDIPEMDKENYIKKYTIEERCLYGKIPQSGVVIDESSGSSGMPNNWVRSQKERVSNMRMLQLLFHLRFGKKQIIFLNAFALGPWATGMNVSMSMAPVSVLKSTGPEITKIINTLLLFGSKYEYIIAGYPPFLKQLVDNKDIDWKKYKITCFYGGEGMTEELRSYLNQSFVQCYGSYGASDLEINIGVENDFTIKLRQLMIQNPALMKDLTKKQYGIPMIFQYNPLDYYIESNRSDELLVTLCRRSNIAPKIRYNIHDLGHVLTLNELKTILLKHGLSFDNFDMTFPDLPIMFMYGRSDYSVAYYGCKVSPATLEANIFDFPQLSENIDSFRILIDEGIDSNKQLTVAIELTNGCDKNQVRSNISSKEFFTNLSLINQDFRESMRIVPEALYPKIEIFNYGEGIFADKTAIKKKYIVVNKNNT